MKKAIGRDIPDYFDTDHLKEHLDRRAVRGGGISIVSRVVGFALQLLGLIVLARLPGAAVPRRVAARGLVLVAVRYPPDDEMARLEGRDSWTRGSER